MTSEHPDWIRVPIASSELVTNNDRTTSRSWFLAIEDRRGNRRSWWATEALVGDPVQCRDVLDAIVTAGRAVRLYDDVHGLEDQVVLHGANLRITPDRDHLRVAFPDGSTAGSCYWTIHQLASDPGAVISGAVGMLATLTASR